jgi:hypothetical protein
MGGTYACTYYSYFERLLLLFHEFERSICTNR